MKETRDKIRFERCNCSDSAPHGWFYKGKNIQLQVLILSLSAAHHLMTLLPNNFKEQQAELEMDVWQAGLPEKVDGDIELVEICLEDMQSSIKEIKMDPFAALLLLASLSLDEKGKKTTDN